MAQVQIWALPNQPLRKQDIVSNGFQSLKDYVRSQAERHNDHQRIACRICSRVAGQPLATFGTFNPATGEKRILMTCMNENELPVEDIPGVYEAGPQNPNLGMVEM